MFLFPERDQQGLQAFFLFSIKHFPRCQWEWVEPDRFGNRKGEIIPTYQVAQPFIAAANIYDHDMGALIIEGTENMVAEHGFPTARASAHEGPPVRDDILRHGPVKKVHLDG